MRPTSLPSFLPEHPETGEHARTIFVDNAALRSNRNRKCRRLDVTGAPGAFQDRHSHSRHSSPLPPSLLSAPPPSLCVHCFENRSWERKSITGNHLLVPTSLVSLREQVAESAHANTSRTHIENLFSFFFFSPAFPFLLLSYPTTSVDSLASCTAHTVVTYGSHSTWPQSRGSIPTVRCMC